MMSDIWENGEACKFFYVAKIDPPIRLSQLVNIAEHFVDECKMYGAWDVECDTDDTEWADDSEWDDVNDVPLVKNPLIDGYIEVSGWALVAKAKDLVHKNGILDDLTRAYDLVPYDGGTDY